MNISHRANPALQMKVLRGFTLAELMVVISILAVLAVILLDRLFWYEGQAEKAAMEHTADMIKSGLWMGAADLMMAERTAEIAALAEQNPMRMLAKKPANYLGEISAEQAASLEDGNWFYDADKRQVIYIVRHRRYFTPLLAQDFMVRYGMLVLYADMETAPGNKVAYITGITLVPLSKYRWR